MMVLGGCLRGDTSPMGIFVTHVDCGSLLRDPGFVKSLSGGILLSITGDCDLDRLLEALSPYQ